MDTLPSQGDSDRFVDIINIGFRLLDIIDRSSSFCPSGSRPDHPSTYYASAAFTLFFIPITNVVALCQS
jgi:hypothetical protein